VEIEWLPNPKLIGFASRPADTHSHAALARIQLDGCALWLFCCAWTPGKYYHSVALSGGDPPRGMRAGSPAFAPINGADDLTETMFNFGAPRTEEVAAAVRLLCAAAAVLPPLKA
jgi:hypothetical protein